MRPELTALPAELLGPRREGPSELPARDTMLIELAAREMGADAAAARAAPTRDVEATLGLEAAVREAPLIMDGRLAGTGRSPALAAAGVCGLAEAETADGTALCAVLVMPEPAVGVLALDRAAEAGVLAVRSVRAVATGVLGEAVLFASELAAAADRIMLDAAEIRPVAVGLTGERTPVDGLMGEEVRDVMLADVGGLDADAEEILLLTLVALVRLVAEGGAAGARLLLVAGARDGVGATLLRGLRRAAAAAEGVSVAAGRVTVEEGVGGGGMDSSSTLCISSSGDKTWT